MRKLRPAVTLVILTAVFLAGAPILAQSDGWAANGKTLFLKAPTYRQVGIGTAYPKATLDVTGGDFTVGRAGKQFIFHSQWWLTNPEFLTIAPQIANGWDFDRSISLWRNGNFQVGNNITQLVMGSAYGESLYWGTSYLGFNLARKPTGWSTGTDTANNGAALIYSNVGGAILFATLPTTGGTARSGITDATIAQNIKMMINPEGKVGIGTLNTGSFTLAVEGKIGAREITVTLDNPWPDYVFDEDYRLLPLTDLERYIQENRHLPDIPSSKEVAAQGVDLGATQALLLRKIEELTRYVIDLKKENDALRQDVEALRGRS